MSFLQDLRSNLYFSQDLNYFIRERSMEAAKNLFKLSSTPAFAGCLLVGISSPVIAQSGNSIDKIFETAAGSSVSSYTDSNGVELDDWSLNYEYDSKNNFKAEVSAHHHYVTAGTNRDKYDGNEITAKFGKKLNDSIEAEINVGAIYLDNRRTDNRTNHTKYKAKIMTKPIANSTISLEHGDDLLFREAIIEDDSNRLLSGKTTKLSGTWRVAKRYIAEASTQHRKLSDGNASNHHRAAVLYGISPDIPWIWAGVEAQSLSYDQRKTNYWSPTEYEAYALVANGNFKVTKNLSVNVNGNINRTKEENHEWASGYSAGVGVDYTLSENTRIKADAIYLKSKREKVDWDSSRIGASFEVSHY